MQTWIPRTKLHPPHTSRVVVRQSLLDELQRAISSCTLTLISAPAGSGKTTLVSALAQGLSMPTAWLSLDESDNDPSVFISVLIAAFQVLDVAYGVTAESLFASGMNVDPKRLVATLINDTLNAPPLLLVLDDFHVIYEQSILQAVDFFLERLPPSVHLVISTRHDPPLSLARLRAQGQLAELRLEALRFDIEETAVLMNQQLELGLTEADLHRIGERTDGWVAGLRLIGLSLLQVSSHLRSQRIAQIIGNNRYIFELLAEEILKHEDGVIQEFLLMTAILDELSPEVCDAVTNRTDSRRVLTSIYRRNLFLRLVDARTDTYRYHDLFAEFLRHQLQVDYPERIAELHRRAATVDPLPQHRIHHYLAASDWDAAAELIIQVGTRIIETGNRLTVQRWIDLLPEPVRNQNGWILYLQGMLAYHRGALQEATPLFERAEARFRETGDRQGIPQALVMAYAASDEYLVRLEPLLGSLKPFALTSFHQLYVKLAPAWVYLYEGQRAESAACFLESLKLAQQHPEVAGFLGTHLSATIVLAFDDVQPLQSHLQALLSSIDNTVSLLKPAILSIMAQIMLWQGNPLEAKALVDESRQQWEQLGGIPHPHHGMVAWQDVTLARMLRDDRAVDALTRGVEDDMNDALHLAYVRARTFWLKGEIRDAQALLDRMPRYFSPETSITGPVYQATIQALITLTHGSIEEVEHILEPYISGQRRRNFYSLYILDLRVTLAYCYFRRGMVDDALHTIEPVLIECERMNMPGRLAQEGDFAIPLMELAAQKHILKAFAQRVLNLLQRDPFASPVIIEETGEVLTPREMDVLRLMMEGATNRDIAETFVISIPTVKTHVSRILQKLNAATRTQAATKARKLSL